eukprot:1083462-Pyramimonas_sp.AAC.1
MPPRPQCTPTLQLQKPGKAARETERTTKRVTSEGLDFVRPHPRPIAGEQADGMLCGHQRDPHHPGAAEHAARQPGIGEQLARRPARALRSKQTLGLNTHLKP